jgi:hypothetical protein
MRTALLTWGVLALGLLVTILSGFYKVHSGYGLPISWRGELESAGSGNTTVWYSWENFAFDAAAWSFVFGIVIIMARRRK